MSNPTPEQRRDDVLAALRAKLQAAEEEVERLNKHCDGYEDAMLKERRTGEEYQRELRERLQAAEQERDASEIYAKRIESTFRTKDGAVDECRSKLAAAEQRVGELQELLECTLPHILTTEACNGINPGARDPRILGDEIEALLAKEQK